MKKFTGFTGCWKASKKCIATFPDADIVVTGSPADIRKVCRDLEKAGYYNLYENAPIMREGHTYQVRFPESWSLGNHAYIVSRA